MQALAQALGGSVGPNPDGNFVLTIEQVSPTPQLPAHFPELGNVVQQALQATCIVASPAADAPAADRASKAAVAAASVPAAAAGQAEAGTDSGGSSHSSHSTGDVLALPVVEQMSTCSLGEGGSNTGSSSSNGGGGSASATLSNATSSSSSISGNGSDRGVGGSACSSGGCFRLIESHGDQVRLDSAFVE